MHNSLGFGLGLRSEHYTSILNTLPSVDWFEIISENYLVPGGRPLYYLDQIREKYPLAMHGVSLSIGSTDPLNWDYLKQLKKLSERVNPIFISDHLCWTGVKGLNMHDLLPLPFTEETLQHVVSRIQQVQDFLGRQLLFENVSSYITFQESSFTEWAFLSQVALHADCHILLDINNIYVSAFNHGFSAEEFLSGIPLDRVKQFHLAGHSNHQTHIIDTHDAPIIDPVFDLYEKAVQHFGAIPTMIERDDNIPPLEDLLLELEQVKKRTSKALSQKQKAASGSDVLI